MLPELAKAIATAFPELESRSFAVSEVDPFDGVKNVPTLPLSVCALVGEEGTQAVSGGGSININDDILVQFMFEPIKYQMEGGEDSVFFAYYDYEAIRDRMLALLGEWRTPRGGGLSFTSLDVESDSFAVYIAFRFKTNEKWNIPTYLQTAAQGVVDIAYRILTPKADCCIPCPTEEDPCHQARLRNASGKEAIAAAAATQT